MFKYSFGSGHRNCWKKRATHDIEKRRKIEIEIDGYY